MEMTIIMAITRIRMGINNNGDKDKLYAIQIQSNGGSTLDTDSIEGKVFAGEKNIERNNGEDFDIKDVFNDCQVVTFSN